MAPAYLSIEDAGWLHITAILVAVVADESGFSSDIS